MFSDNSEFMSLGFNCQRHVHELVGSVEIAEDNNTCHNHRFTTVSGEAIRTRSNGCSSCNGGENSNSSNDHVHDVRFRTDFFDGHFHEYFGRTSGPIKVGNRHIHYLESVTTQNDGHKHKFRLATLIENPIGD